MLAPPAPMCAPRPLPHGNCCHLSLSTVTWSMPVPALALRPAPSAVPSTCGTSLGAAPLRPLRRQAHQARHLAKVHRAVGALPPIALSICGAPSAPNPVPSSWPAPASGPPMSCSGSPRNASS
eukprot:UN4544